MLTLKVINLWAGPGAGKSTLGAGLFNLMKNLGEKVELVTEVAKDVTYEANWSLLQNQLYILAKQDTRLRRLEGQVEWVITDSPLPIQIAYTPKEYEYLRPTIWDTYDRYQNYDVFVGRVKPYATYGRSQTEREAKALDKVIADIFRDAVDEDLSYALWVDGDFDAPRKVYSWLERMR